MNYFKYIILIITLSISNFAYGATYNIQPVANPDTTNRAGNVIEQTFTGITGITESLTLSVRRSGVGGSDLTTNRLSRIKMCDDSAMTINCVIENLTIDLQLTATNTCTEHSWNIPQGSSTLEIQPDKYVSYRVARTTFTQILLACGDSTNPISYSDQLGGDTGFDIFSRIITDASEQPTGNTPTTPTIENESPIPTIDSNIQFDTPDSTLQISPVIFSGSYLNDAGYTKMILKFYDEFDTLTQEERQLNASGQVDFQYSIPLVNSKYNWYAYLSNDDESNVSINISPTRESMGYIFVRGAYSSLLCGEDINCKTKEVLLQDAEFLEAYQDLDPLAKTVFDQASILADTSIIRGVFELNRIVLNEISDEPTNDTYIIAVENIFQDGRDVEFYNPDSEVIDTFQPIYSFFRLFSVFIFVFGFGWVFIKRIGSLVNRFNNYYN